MHINQILTNGKFDNTKFKSFYNLSRHEEDMKKQANESFGTFSMQLLTNYTEIFKDYTDSQNEEILKEIKSLIIKFKIAVDINSYAVKYLTIFLELS